jgi:hypothetical protein
MRRVLALLLAALPLGAVDGVVTNRSAGRAQAQATVSLFKLGGAGPEMIESVKTGADGKFAFAAKLDGPGMVQAVYQGVVYTRMLQGGAPQTGLSVEVFDVVKQAPPVAQHMVLFEPAAGRLAVTENFLFQNEGNTTYHDPANGTLRYYVPPGAEAIQITATAPQSVPVRQAPLKTATANVYKLDLAIKPGETSVQISYTLPYQPPLKFASRRLFRGGPTSLIAPDGVQIAGEGLEPRGQEPRTRASIFQTSAATYGVEISGEGALRQQGGDSGEEGGPAIEQILPRIYREQGWILGLSFGALFCAFVLMWRRGAQPAAPPRGRDK